MLRLDFPWYVDSFRLKKSNWANPSQANCHALVIKRIFSFSSVVEVNTVKYDYNFVTIDVKRLLVYFHPDD